MENTRKHYIITGSIAVGAVLLITAGGALAYWHQAKDFGAKVAALEASQNSLQASLQKQIAATQYMVIALASSTESDIIPLQKMADTTPTMQKSQEQLLTAAVAKVAPEVVSIVVSEEVPQLQVTYVNPFGNDPNFQNFNIQIPVYQQKGSAIENVAAGTGFMVSRDGYILTNKHVVADANANYTVLLSDGTQKAGQVVYRDPTNDIALVKIDGTYPNAATLGDSSTLELGQTVAAIGNALGEYNNSVSVGVISGLNRDVEATDQETGATEDLTGMLQTDAAINPGNSGGPLINLNGDVVGINVATVVGSNNIGFSIPINMIKAIVEKEIP